MTEQPGDEEIDRVYKKLHEEAEAGGYHLNPDEEFTRDLVRGLLVNEKRYGYWGCPCRLASGDKEKDLDIICPCYYRDPDLNEYGQCYCALYVTTEVLQDKKKTGSIPERREQEESKQEISVNISSIPYPLWRCKVCGYLCARDSPPEECPVCKAKKERFERFI
ncbi:MAG: ferredoxin-thioredoxin reductase catalytic domain-containing protein [Archaeoglobaceae archaeon]